MVLPVPESVLNSGPIRSAGLRDDVYQAILRLLMSGALPPDSPLGIDALARALEVSPTPVREALARLEHTGLVLRSPRRGYRVAPPMSAEQVAELADARLVLEVGAIRRAVERDGQQLTSELERAYESHVAAGARLDKPSAINDLDAVYEYFNADWGFHQVILDHCGNRYLNEAVNALQFSVHRMRQTLGAGATDAPLAICEHSVILDAVRTGDAAAAEQAMSAHLDKVLHRSNPEA